MAAIDEKPQYAVITIAMDQRKRAALRMAFKMHRSRRYVLFDEGMQRKPDLAIVDADGPTGMQAWKDFRTQHPQLPGVLLSLNPTELLDGLVVPKPLHVEVLFPTLEQTLVGKAVPPAIKTAQETARTAVAPTSTHSQTAIGRAYPAVRRQPWDGGKAFAPAKKVRPTSPRPARRVTPFVPPKYFDARRGILGLLCQLREKQKTAWIDSANRKGILAVLPKENRAFMDVSEEEFKGLCQRGVKLKTRPMGNEALGMMGNAQLPSLESLIWRAARWTSRGRLPAGVRIGRTVLHVTHWPNFTRLEHRPDDLRMAAFLSRNQASVALTLKMLNVKPEDLYSFISAAFSLGLLSQTEKTTTRPRHTQELETAEAQERRGVLSKLLRKLVGR